MKFKITVSTDKVGSQVEKIVEIDDEELANYEDDSEREGFIEEYCQEEVNNMINWGYHKV